MSAPSLGLDSIIDQQMTRMGGILNDLDKFILGPHTDCDIDGYDRYY
jgi:hypothetical protein